MGLPEITRELAASDNFLITCHINPDGDAIGSLAGMLSLLHALGKRAVAISPDPVPNRYRFIPGTAEILSYHEAEGQGPFDTAAILDVGSFDRIGEVEKLISEETKIINIDHHPSNNGFGDAAWVDDKSSAVAEMLYELYRKFKIRPDPNTALALYVGIMTDTGRFRFSNTSSRCFATAAALVELGADPAIAAEKVYYTTPAVVVTTLRKFLSRVEQYDEGRIALSHLNKVELEVDTEGFVDNITGIHGVIISVLLQEIKSKKYKASLRSNSNNIDVSAIAQSFGGGGHRKAAGCRIPGTLNEVKNIIIDACTEALHS